MVESSDCNFLVVITIVPLIYVLVASFMDPATLINKGISFNPKDWTIQGYQRVLADDSILRGFINSLFYSFSFSLLTVFITMITAYPLSRPNLAGKKIIMTFCHYNVRWWRLDTYLFIGKELGHVR